MYWWDIIGLSKINQNDRSSFLTARLGKVTSSDFADAVPATEKYLKHIIDMWDIKNVKFSEATTIGDKSYAQYMRRKLESYTHDHPTPIPNMDFANPTCMMAKGNMYEAIIKNLTSQIYFCCIAECGPVMNNRIIGSGASPDGVLMESKVSPSGKPIRYSCRNFEAKTAVKRVMNKKIPIKYHIQTEKTAYELGLTSSVYTEAQFCSMPESRWRRETENYVVPKMGGAKDEFSRYGLMISHRMTHHYPNCAVYTPQQYLRWRDNKIEELLEDGVGTGDRPYVTYFKVVDLWTTEFKIFDKYTDVYVPLIHKQVDLVKYITGTEKGMQLFKDKFAVKQRAETSEPLKRRTPAAKKSVDHSALLDLVKTEGKKDR